MRGKFYGVGHDTGVFIAFFVEEGADIAYSPIHHIAGSDEIGTRGGCEKRHFCKEVDGRIVEDVSAFIDEAVKSMICKRV